MYIKVYEGVQAFINPLCQHCFFSTFLDLRSGGRTVARSDGRTVGRTSNALQTHLERT